MLSDLSEKMNPAVIPRWEYDMSSIFLAPRLTIHREDAMEMFQYSQDLRCHQTQLLAHQQRAHQTISVKMPLFLLASSFLFDELLERHSRFLPAGLPEMPSISEPLSFRRRLILGKLRCADKSCRPQGSARKRPPFRRDIGPKSMSEHRRPWQISTSDRLPLLNTASFHHEPLNLVCLVGIII